jgi:ABC-2 type transport system ATP-binding protein
VIEIAGLTKTYGQGGRRVAALSGIDLEVRNGMLGVLGPNGAGKTTLIRILAGIVNPSGGSVRIAGQDMASERGRQVVKAMLGYLPQDLGMHPELTAWQFVDYMAILKGLDDPRDRRRRVDAALETVGMPQAAGCKIRGLSGGMKRRIGIAQALVNCPKLLIVDEPTAGLDPEERIRFRNLLVSIASGCVVILSTHIVEDIAQTCRDIAILERGRLLFRGSPSGLTAAAEGHVWTLALPAGEQPGQGCTVVSAMHLADGVRYRIVGACVPGAESVPPSLEDAYVWLMRTRTQAASATRHPAGVQ